jgi:hypothetical protein
LAQNKQEVLVKRREKERRSGANEGGKDVTN